MSKSLRIGFVKADSSNLPRITEDAVVNFCMTIAPGPESRGTKLQKASRPQYGDESVGMVELKRNNSVVNIVGRVTPEHKVRDKPYVVEVVFDEENDVVISARCLDCVASEGGCKHAVTLLFWLHRRSEEPSCTSVQSYWRKSRLSTVPTTSKLSLRELTGTKYKGLPSALPSSSSPLNYAEEVQELMTSHGVRNMLTCLNEYNILSLHHLHVKYASSNDKGSFIEYCKRSIKQEHCDDGQRSTVDQSKSKLWFELRYGRITASKLHEAAHCHTEDGCLVQQILGASKKFTTSAMERGLKIEDQVIKEAEKKFKIRIKKCGFFIRPDMPIFGASPDGITKDFVVEVKAPTTLERKKAFVNDGVLSAKLRAQVDLQMHVCQVKKCLLLIASPDFETSREFDFYWVNYYDQYLQNLLEKSTKFWENNVQKFL